MTAPKNLDLIGKIPWRYPRGPRNALIDVGDVRVGHLSLIKNTRDNSGKEIPVRTGLTAIVPEDMKGEHRFFFHIFPFRNTGEITGYAVTEDFCYLNSPVMIANALNLGSVYNAVLTYGFRLGRSEIWPPVVLAVDDSDLNAQNGSDVDENDVIELLRNASKREVGEGSVGAGVGLRAFGWKGGIGTSSRTFRTGGTAFTAGALVASGQSMSSDRPEEAPPNQENGPPAVTGSLTVVLATDLPLLPHQMRRVCQGIVVSLPGAVSGKACGGSITCALFSVANAMSLKDEGPKIFEYTAVNDSELGPVCGAGLESVVESVLRSLCLSEPVEGRRKRRVDTMPEEKFRAFLRICEDCLPSDARKDHKSR